MSTGHLRLVVDNTKSEQIPANEAVSENDVALENASLILHLLNQLGEINVVETWQQCIEFPVSKEDDKYNQFMARNWHHFSNLLMCSQQDNDLQQKHRMANYFMMKVYMAIMNSRTAADNSLSLMRGPYKPTQLDFWINRFALKIINNESQQAKNDFDPSPNDFGNRVRRVIESA